MSKELEKLLELSTELKVPKGFFIYFLFDENVLVYIGKSNSLLNRIGTHTSDKDFTSVKYIPVEKEEQDRLELALIKTFKPKYNTQKLSTISDDEKGLLLRYSIKDSIINAIVRSLPVYGKYSYKYGVCAFFNEDGLLSLGLLDDTTNDFEDDEHNEDCEYIHKKLILEDSGIKITNEIDVQLMDNCHCEKAIVYDGKFEDGYLLMNFNELHNLSGCQEMDNNINEFESMIFSGLHPEVVDAMGYR